MNVKPGCIVGIQLTHWGQDKTVAILLTTFWNAFSNENTYISIKISLKFVPKDPINNITALVHVMGCRRPGAKPLSEPMIVILPTHICVTLPQWFNCVQRNLIEDYDY